MGRPTTRPGWTEAGERTVRRLRSPRSSPSQLQPNQFNPVPAATLSTELATQELLSPYRPSAKLSSHQFPRGVGDRPRSHRASPTSFPGAGHYLGNDHVTSKEILQSYIRRACDPMLHEPNMSLNLEIADLINSKKANTPREAAVEVSRLANSTNQHVAMLALSLLDTLVKNCGYPFHLQISTKEFLNELVRRFPERPPTFPPPAMARVLGLIHEWKMTLCVHSKHKEDLVHIRDMHRLLSFKGYRFPDFDKRAASVLNPTESLQTPEELEEEDRAAQAAKLQELIRRGTPKDLAAAQELMKIMAGAEPEKRPDYEQQVEKELDRIQQRVLLLNEMLNNAKPNERFVDGDAFDQIAQKCRHVQPKIQKWIADSTEDDVNGNMDRLLMMNDLINNVVNRYEAFKKGDRSATAEIDPALAPGAATSKAKAQAAQVSLIDFDFDDAPSPAAAGPSSNPIDDLAGLGALSLGPSTPASAPPLPQAQTSNNVGSLFDLDFSSPAPAPTNNGGYSVPSTAQPPQSSLGGGAFFSNPAYGGGLNSNRASTVPSPAPSGSNIPWSTTATNASSSRASTPGLAGAAIQLPGSRPGSAQPVSPAAASPYDGMAAFGHQQSQVKGAPPVPQKDAFEDLLL